MSQFWVCLSPKVAKNVPWPWLSLAFLGASLEDYMSGSFGLITSKFKCVTYFLAGILGEKCNV